MRRLAIILLLTSCVMTETHYRDNFEGRWHSDHLPLGDLAEEMILDIADGKVDVIIDDNPVGGGEYHLDNDVMVLGWSVEWYGIDFQLLEAFGLLVSIHYGI